MTEPLATCAFGRAILAGEAGCTLARRQARGEMESIACASPVAVINCGTLVALLRERGTFALRLPPPGRPLAYALVMRLQCGGARALAAELGRERPDDLHGIVAEARLRWCELAGLPFAPIVAAMAAWRPRRRGTARE